MNTPDVRLSPDEVAALSDEELSAHVIRVVLGLRVFDSWAELVRARGTADWDDFVGDGYAWRPAPGRRIAGAWIGAVDFADGDFHPDNPVAVEHVREHMRGRWKTEAARYGVSRHWKMENGDSDVRPWIVSVWSRGPSPHANSRLFKASGLYGRALMECALLAAQEMQRRRCGGRW
jgi:hypothetical protein